MSCHTLQFILYSPIIYSESFLFFLFFFHVKGMMEAAMQNCAAAADAVSTVITSPLFSDDAPQINSIHVSLSSPDTSCYHNNHAVWFKAYSFCILYFLNNTRDPDSFSAVKIHCYNQKRVSIEKLLIKVLKPSKIKYVTVEVLIGPF